MTFTKTSQKFGQWSDVRANTVYGLGFGSEIELNKVARKDSINISRIIKHYYLFLNEIIMFRSVPLNQFPTNSL